MPSADQSRCASSISLSDLLIHTARRRPFSQLSRRMPATWRPFPAPVPSPSIQPRRKRTDCSRIVGRGRDDIEGLVDNPRSGEIAAMGFAGIDDAFELRVGEKSIGDDIGRQPRPVRGLGWRDRRHRRRLYEPGRMRLRSGNADRLQSVSFIQRLGDAPTFGGLPVDRLIDKIVALGFDRAGRDGDGARRWIVGASRERASSYARSDSGRDRQSRRNLRRHPVEQHGRIGGHAGRRRKRRRIVGRHAGRSR